MYRMQGHVMSRRGPVVGYMAWAGNCILVYIVVPGIWVWVIFDMIISM